MSYCKEGGGKERKDGPKGKREVGRGGEGGQREDRGTERDK